jgi:prolyl oligopeptidase
VVYPGEETKVYSSYENQKEASFLQNDEHKLYFHKLERRKRVIFGADQNADIGGYVTEDDAYLVISAANSTYGNELYIKDLKTKQSYRYNRRQLQ